MSTDVPESILNLVFLKLIVKLSTYVMYINPLYLTHLQFWTPTWTYSHVVRPETIPAAQWSL